MFRQLLYSCRVTRLAGRIILWPNKIARFSCVELSAALCVVCVIYNAIFSP
jgi:hypothetical protein